MRESRSSTSSTWASHRRISAPRWGRIFTKESGLRSLRSRPLISIALEYTRVGLHSKPDEEVEAWYRKRGLTACERETLSDGTWLYFEGSPEWTAKAGGRGGA